MRGIEKWKSAEKHGETKNTLRNMKSHQVNRAKRKQWGNTAPKYKNNNK